MKIKLQKLNELYASIEANSPFTGVKIAYAVAKNKKIIKDLLEPISEVGAPSPEYSKFDAERVKLCTEHAKKDANGSPVVVGSKYIMMDQKAFDAAFTELKEQFAVVIEKREQQGKEIDDLLNSEVEVTFHSVPEEILESSSLNSNQIAVLLEMI
jgi:hypothetical protein